MFSRFFPKLAALTLLLSSACASLFSAPVITTQPADKTILTGASVDLSVSATGIAPLTYRWDVSTNGGSTWAPVSADALHGAPNQATLQLNAVPLTWQNCRYRVAVSDASSTTIVSNPITLTVEYSELWGMGNNTYGQLGDGTVGYTIIPEQINSDAAAIAVGANHTLFLKLDGTLWTTGANDFGQLGDGTLEAKQTPVKIAEQVTKIAAASNQSFFIKTDGTLWACGNNQTGQLGAGVPTQITTPVQIATQVSAVAAGNTHVIFLKTDGTLWGAGNDSTHRQFASYAGLERTPAQIYTGMVALEGVSAISAGPNQSFYIKNDGSLWAMGDGRYGMLGTGLTTGSAGSHLMIGTDFVAVSCGTEHSLFLKADGTVWSAGLNLYGEIGNGTQQTQTTLVQVASGATRIATGNYASYVIKTDGTLLAFGRNNLGQLGDGTQIDRVSPTVVATNVNAIAASSHTVVLKSNGSVWATGLNERGQLGNGVVSYRTKPVFITDNVTSYVARSTYSMFVKSNGSLWGMGSNSQGQLGIGITTGRPTPIQIDTDVATVSAGSSHTLYVKADGSLWGMGSNTNGQLGNGTTQTQPVPVQIATGVKRAFSSLASTSTYFLKGEGELWAMGNNSSGQLGNAPSASWVLSPQLIRNDIRDAFPSSSHLLYTLSNDAAQALWGTGTNYWGQLGIGSTANQVPPTKITENVVAAASAGVFSFYITSDGVLHGMGNNGSGQLGNGVIADRQITPVTIMADVAFVSPGWAHSLIGKTDGGLWTTGLNVNGALGDGTTTDRATPVQVATQVTSASGGYYHSLFLKRGVPEAPIITTQPQAASIEINRDTTLQVSVRGLPTPQYQWRKNGMAISGANETSLSFSESQVADSGNYDVVITNSLGTVTSQVATLTVAPPVAPSIVTQPIGAYQIVGGSHSFSVTAAGTAPLTYQWLRDGIPLTDQAQPTLTLDHLLLADAADYTVKITNPAGSVTSHVATLHVENLPAIITAPARRITAEIGQPLSLTFTATSTYSPLTYQWKWNNRPISGANSAAYTLPSFSSAQAGAYTLEITDAHGYLTRHTTFVLPNYATTQVTVLGVNDHGQTQVPPALANVIAVSAGGWASFAVKKDGSVTAWGGDSSLYAETVVALTDVVEIAGGSDTSLVLKSDGTVQEIRSMMGPPQASLPSNLSGVIAVAKGYNHGLALKDDGTVAVWGSNSSGQLALPSGLTNVTAIAAGGDHSLALKSDGTVVAWGDGVQGQTTVPSGLSGVTAIAAYGTHSVALKSDGTAVEWGLPSRSLDVSATAIAASSQNIYAIQTDGSVREWHDYGFYGWFVDIVKAEPEGNALEISAGNAHALVLWDASAGSAPSITTQPASIARYTAENHTFSVIAAGDEALLAYQWRRNGINIPGATQNTYTLENLSLSDAGTYDVLVSNHVGTTSSNAATLTVVTVPVVTSLSSPRQVLISGETLTLSVSATGTGPLSYQWYRNGRVLTGATQASLSVPNANPQASGYYWVKVTDNNGPKQSATFFVNVVPARTQLRAWGNNGQGPVNLPVGLNDVVSFAIGESHGLAIRRNGSLVGWGDTSHGRLDLVNTVTDAVAVAVNDSASYVLKSDGTILSKGYPGLSDFPAGLSDVVAIDVELTTGLALRSNGTVVGWGYDYGVNEVPLGLDNVSAIALGKTVAIALKRDGTVVTWGSSMSGVPVPAAATDIVAVAAGIWHALALKADGTVVAWGTNLSGATDVPAGLNNVVAIEAYHERSAAIKADGTVVYWGYRNESEPPPPEAISVIQVGLGVAYVAVLRDASADAVTAIIAQPAGQTLGEGAKATFSVGVNGVGPFGYQWRKNGISIEGATSASLVIRNLTFADAGAYDVLVTNHLGSISSSSATLIVKAVPTITSLSPTRHVRAPGETLNLSVTATGTGLLHYQWTRNGQPIPGATSANLSIPALTLKDSGYYLALITDNNGTKRSAPIFVTVAPVLTQVVGWGSSSSGQFQVPAGLSNAIAVAGGSSHTLILDRTGKVTVLGSGNIAPTGLSDIVSIAAGDLHSLALKSDGTVVAWGGYSSTGENIVPTGLTNVVAIAAGDSTSAAIQSDGNVIVWGSNQFNLLSIPTDLDAVTSVAIGTLNMVALRNDGTVVQWKNDTTMPSDLTNVRAVAAGHTFAIALRANGSIAGWGSDFSLLPPSSLGTGFTAIASRNFHSLALHDNGTVAAWGFGNHGENDIPTGLAGVFAIGAGRSTSYALRDATNDIAPSITKQPQSGSFSPGQNVMLSVTALGDSLSYQWRKNGAVIGGATSPVLSFTSLSTSDAGSYDVVVSNHLGSVTSTPATLSVSAASGFIQSLFQHLVQRAPTSSEQQAIQAQLAAGASRTSIVLDLLDTPEYQARQWERVIRLYYATFNRMPDYPGLLSWSETFRSGIQTPEQIGAAFAGSAEFVSTYGSLTNAQFVQQLYRNVLGREADQLGIDTWGASLAEGMTRGALLLAFADSAEFQNRMAHTVEVVRLYTLLHGRTPYNSELLDWTDFLRGVDLTDIMLTSSEFQALHPLGFTHTEYLNVIFPGFLRRAPDSATLSGLNSQLQASQTTRPRLVADLIESGEFNAFVAPVVRFYLACLNRSPDTVGLNHWTHQLRSGTSLAGLADAFALSAEFNSRYGAMSNGQFVSQLYFDTLGRGPDANGLNHWTFQLNSSGESRASMLLTFANSDEAVERFAPNIRSFLHHSTFLNRLPSQAEDIFWHDYLSTLELQFIDSLLSSGPY